jgi:hypothetical protein
MDTTMSNINNFGIKSNVRLDIFGKLSRIFALTERILSMGYDESAPVIVCTEPATCEEATPVASLLADALDAERDLRLAKLTGDNPKEPTLSFAIGQDKPVVVDIVKLIAHLRTVVMTGGGAVEAVISDGHRRIASTTLANAVADVAGDAITIELPDRSVAIVECSADEWQAKQIARATGNLHAERLDDASTIGMVADAIRSGLVCRQADLTRAPFGWNTGLKQRGYAAGKMAFWTGLDPVEIAKIPQKDRQPLRTRIEADAKKQGVSPRDIALDYVQEAIDAASEPKGPAPLTLKKVQEMATTYGAPAPIRAFLALMESGDESAVQKLFASDVHAHQEWCDAQWPNED